VQNVTNQRLVLSAGKPHSGASAQAYRSFGVVELDSSGESSLGEKPSLRNQEFVQLLTLVEMSANGTVRQTRWTRA